MISKKVKAIQDAGLIPMLCVGETLDEREKGDTEKVISQQLVEGLSLADLTQEFVIAYEPVWAIGTGKVATPEIAEKAHFYLRGILSEVLKSKNKAEDVSILYGGSVKRILSRRRFIKSG